MPFEQTILYIMNQDLKFNVQEIEEKKGTGGNNVGGLYDIHSDIHGTIFSHGALERELS